MDGVLTSSRSRRGRKLSKPGKESGNVNFEECRFSPIGHKKMSKDPYQTTSNVKPKELIQ